MDGATQLRVAEAFRRVFAELGITVHYPESDDSGNVKRRPEVPAEVMVGYMVRDRGWLFRIEPPAASRPARELPFRLVLPDESEGT